MQILLLTLTRSVANVDNNHTNIDNDDLYPQQHTANTTTITRKTPTTTTTSPALSIDKDSKPRGGLSLALAWTTMVSTPTLSLPMDDIPIDDPTQLHHINANA